MQKFFSLLAIALAVSACSMKNRTESYQVNVQMPNSSSVNAKYSHPAAASSSSTPAPGDIATTAALAGFRCFALNIVGSGIAPDPRFGCTSATAGMGQMIGMADISGGSVAGDVLAGPSRTIQLIGAKFEASSNIQGCPSFDSILSAAANPNNAFNGVDVYLLGQTTTDIYSDVSVPIVANFSSSTSMFNNCSGSGGNNNNNNNPPQIGFDYFGPQTTSAISLNSCLPVGIYANNFTAAGANPPADFSIAWNSTSNGAMTFSTNSDCSGGTTLSGMNNSVMVGNTAFPWTGGYLPLYMEAAGFTAPVNLSLTGVPSAYNTSTLQLNMVSTASVFVPYQNSISLLTSPPTFTPNTGCKEIDIRGYPGGSTPRFANILVSNAAGGSNTPPAVKIYSNPGTAGDCSGSDAVQVPTMPPYTGGNQNFYFNVPLTQEMSVNESFWIADTTSENLMLEVSDASYGAQPTKFSVNFYQPGPAAASASNFTIGGVSVANGQVVTMTGTDPGLKLQLRDANSFPLTVSIGTISCSITVGGGTVGTIGTVAYSSNGIYNVPFTPGTTNGTIGCMINGAYSSVNIVVLSQAQTQLVLSQTSFPTQGGPNAIATIVPKDSTGAVINDPNLTISLNFSTPTLNLCFSSASQGVYQNDGTYQVSFFLLYNGSCASGGSYTGMAQPMINGTVFPASLSVSVGP